MAKCDAHVVVVAGGLVLQGVGWVDIHPHGLATFHLAHRMVSWVCFDAIIISGGAS